MQVKVDLLRVQLVEEAEQIDQTAAKTIHRPGGDHIDLAAGNRLEEPLHRGAALAWRGAADAVVIVDPGDGPAVPHGHRLQLADLIFGGLIVRSGFAGIDQ